MELFYVENHFILEYLFKTTRELQKTISLGPTTGVFNKVFLGSTREQEDFLYFKDHSTFVF